MKSLSIDHWPLSIAQRGKLSIAHCQLSSVGNFFIGHWPMANGQWPLVNWQWSRLIFFILTLGIGQLAMVNSWAMEIGGSTVLEVSARLSNELKARMQDHLNKIFGYGKSEVFVQIDVGFSKDIKGDLERTLRAYLSGETSRAAQVSANSQEGGNEPGYQWLFPGLSSEAGAGAPGGGDQSFILPGFSAQGTGVASAGSGGGGSGAGSRAISGAVNAFSDPNFLYAIGLETKRVFIKVALDYSLPNDSETKVQALATALLDIDPNRGDRVVITRFKMPNPIFELFKDPTFLGVVLKWATVGGLMFVGLILAAGLIILTLRSMFGILEHWVEAFLAMRHRSMELKLDLPPWMKDALPAIRIKKEEQLEQHTSGGSVMVSGGGRSSSGALVGPSGPVDIVIDIPAQRAQELVHLIGKENPAHVAMVVARLPPATRSVFLTHLPAERLAPVMAALSRPQFVEAAVMTRLKEELEKRIVGVVGGESEIIKTLEASSLILRSKLLKNLESQDQVLYRAVRRKILLFEDLGLFSDTELNTLLSKVPIQELTTAISSAMTAADLREKVIRSLPKKTAQTLTEMLAMTVKPSDIKAMEAQDKILQAAQKMIIEGTLAHPLAQVVLENKS